MGTVEWGDYTVVAHGGDLKPRCTVLTNVVPGGASRSNMQEALLDGLKPVRHLPKRYDIVVPVRQKQSRTVKNGRK